MGLARAYGVADKPCPRFCDDPEPVEAPRPQKNVTVRAKPAVTEPPPAVTTVTCAAPGCAKPVTGKARFCCGACKVRAHRAKANP
jgi:hypothetical protein